MSGTYIKLNLGNGWGQYKGGAYLDSIAVVVENGKDKDRTRLHFSGVDAYSAIINKPLEEVEQMLADAKHAQMIAGRSRKLPETLDWRDISGEIPKPEKEPKQGLAKRFHLKR